MARTGLQEQKAYSACACAENREAWKSGYRDSPCFQGVSTFCEPTPTFNLLENVSMLHENVVGSKYSNRIYHYMENQRIAPEVLWFETSRMATYPGT